MGVFPSHRQSISRDRGLPHARGGVSSPRRWRCLGSLSSPRTWGCFFAGPQRGRGWGVFPTHVGVFPFDLRTIFQRLCLPHARGGVSNPGLIQFFNQPSSPRTWGCFQTSSSTSTALQVFPTHVGVFLYWLDPDLYRHGLPHARGGVSLSWWPLMLEL